MEGLCVMEQAGIGRFLPRFGVGQLENDICDGLMGVGHPCGVVAVVRVGLTPPLRVFGFRHPFP